MKVAKRCDKCNELIVGDAVAGLNKHYHLKCFQCSKCNGPITDKYGVLGGRVVCAKCKTIADNRRCDLCFNSIEVRL